MNNANSNAVGGTAGGGGGGGTQVSFWETYEHICALKNLVPIQSLKVSLASEGGTVLNLNADKLRTADWDPVYGALRINKGLKKIVIASNYNPQSDNDGKK